MLEKDHYKIDPKPCHITLELKDRGKLSVPKADNIFRYIAEKANDDIEWYYVGGLLHFEFDRALICYGFGIDSGSILEIYSLLETRLIERLRKEFRSIKLSKPLFRYLKNKSHLFDIEFFLRKYRGTETAQILKNLGILENSDCKFIEKLEGIRDGLAHKNLQHLAHKLASHNVHLSTIDTNALGFDIAEFLLDACRLEYKLLTKKEKKALLAHVKKFDEELKKEGKGRSLSQMRNTEKIGGHLTLGNR